MQKRGWIEETSDTDQLERQLQSFFGTDSLDGDIIFPVATRRTQPLRELSSAERAWCFRARQMAVALKPTTAFLANRLGAAEQNFVRSPHIRRKRAICRRFFRAMEFASSWSNHCRAERLTEQSFGLMSSRLQWLSLYASTESTRFGSPSCMSFHISDMETLCRSIWTLLAIGPKAPQRALIEDEHEHRANLEASAALVPSGEMDSFVRRVGPLYAKSRIVQFAHRMKIHPGIIVGQLHHRGEISFRTNREF